MMFCILFNLHTAKSFQYRGNRLVTTVAGNQPILSDGVGTLSGFKGPSGIAIDASSTYMLIADSSAKVVRKMDFASFNVVTLGNFFYDFQLMF
jgi:hypothetical protein